MAVLAWWGLSLKDARRMPQTDEKMLGRRYRACIRAPQEAISVPLWSLLFLTIVVAIFHSNLSYQITAASCLCCIHVASLP